MPVAETAASYFDALTEAQTALLDVAYAAGQSQLSLQQRLIDEVRTAQGRSLELAKRMAEQPTDIGGNVSALIAVAGEAQNQALGFARYLMEGAPETQAEMRRRSERIAKANQEIVRVTIAATRDLFTVSPWFDVTGGAGQAAPSTTQKK